MIDLWPEDIQTVRAKAPVTILKEQAAFLSQRTKNIVTTEVVPRKDSVTVFKFFFYLVGPAIGNYRYRLFTMEHGAALYPLTLHLAPGVLPEALSITVHSHDEFLAALRRVFSADKTVCVVRAILALSGVEPGE